MAEAVTSYSAPEAKRPDPVYKDPTLKGREHRDLEGHAIPPSKARLLASKIFGPLNRLIGRKSLDEQLKAEEAASTALRPRTTSDKFSVIKRPERKPEVDFNVDNAPVRVDAEEIASIGPGHPVVGGQDKTKI